MLLLKCGGTSGIEQPKLPNKGFVLMACLRLEVLTHPRSLGFDAK
jgi:hypothetical protein